MKTDAYTPFIIISAQTSEASAAKDRNSLTSDLVKLGITFHHVRGCYKGVEEDSFLIHGKHLDEAVTLGKKYGQESLLLVNAYSVASLYSLPTADGDTNTHVIGTFLSCTEELAKEQTGWTRSDAGQYYYINANK